MQCEVCGYEKDSQGCLQCEGRAIAALSVPGDTFVVQPMYPALKYTRANWTPGYFYDAGTGVGFVNGRCFIQPVDMELARREVAKSFRAALDRVIVRGQP